ncbi:hypothetical protein CUMW_226100 [Citrus unshiu]|uniref:Cytochrome P450 n=1 Tax=Citrus unshiu TaxID=55188 RepID=A0A2H5QFX7_CITUN|nr:hypothetical protein CUMW_226100 [Citrus unshiu]
MSWLWTLLVLAAIFFFLRAFSWKTNTKNRRILPPEPKVFQFSDAFICQFPPRALHKLAKVYGHIMHLCLVLVTTIVQPSNFSKHVTLLLPAGLLFKLLSMFLMTQSILHFPHMGLIGEQSKKYAL